MSGIPLFRSPLMGLVAGDTLRPGGIELTTRLLHLAGIGSGFRLLDAGCGLGASASLAESLGATVTGVDVCADMLATARASHPGLRLVKASAEALPFALASYDAILSECVLSLMPHRDAAIRELARVLRPGGVLALADMYARQPRKVPGCSSSSAHQPPCHPGGIRASGCAAGAITLAAMQEELARRGFVVAHVEDQSRALAELAAKLIFAGLPVADLGAGCTSRPGYVLIVARKEARR